MTAASFPDLDTALAAMRLGPIRFRCRVCGRTHVSGSLRSEACAEVIKGPMRMKTVESVDAPATSSLERKLRRVQEVYAPWLGLPVSGLPLCYLWSRPERDLFAASLAVGAPPGEADRELRAWLEAAKERWLAWARAEAPRLAKEYEETAAEALKILARPAELFEFELRRGSGGRVEYVRPLPAGWMPVPRRVWFRETNGSGWAYHVAKAAGFPVTTWGTSWPSLWDVRYSANELFLEISPPGGSRMAFWGRFEAETVTLVIDRRAVEAEFLCAGKCPR